MTLLIRARGVLGLDLGHCRPREHLREVPAKRG
jgi:hypothetical protein